MSEIIKAFPLFSIICCFVGAVICSFTNKKLSFITSLVVCAAVFVLSVITLSYCMYYDTSFIYTMGHFDPNEEGIRICNEIRFGVLECFLAAFFSLVLALCILGGKYFQNKDINEKKQNLFYVMMCLILVANNALIYTNDIFTGFVFLEVSTLASCGCLMVKEKGPTILSTIRYMIFNLVGSGLFLIGIVICYNLTGCLSIENIATVIKTQELGIAHYVSFTLVIIGLAIKGGLFPFHFWMPDAYGCATPTSSSVLSGIVTKGYIILLIKVIYRMFTYEVLAPTGLLNILFVFGVLGMIVGSINAIHQKSIDRMIAFSSAAQIGYVFMGIGLGYEAALVAAFFHILTHAVTKPLLFISAEHLSCTSDGSKKFRNLRGCGRVDIVSGVAFSVGALSMVGIPLFAGFISKYLFVDAALLEAVPTWMKVSAMSALIISTVLNAIYFVRTMFTIYLPVDTIFGPKMECKKYCPMCLIGMIGLVILNIGLGVSSSYIVKLIADGFAMFI